MKLSLLALLLISSVSFQNEASLGQQAQLDQEFKIKMGQEASVDKLRIRFDTVAQDRRCPCETECSSHRNAAVIFKLESPQSVAKYIVLTAYSKPDEIQSRGYKLRLLKLDPCPQSHGSHIDMLEYEATLLVTKSQDAAGNADDKSLCESKPNFGGEWLHREALDAGTSLTVSHLGSELSATSSRFVRGRDYITKDIYYIDGRAHITTRTEYYEDSSTNQKHRYKTSKVRSVVKWDGDKLVIVDGRGQSEWELSESGRELILGNGKQTRVYKRVS